MLLRAVKLDPSHHLPAPLAALRVCGNQAVRRFADHHTPPPHLPVAARTLVAPRLDLRQDELVDDAMRNLPEGLYEILIDVALEARLTAMEIQADSIADFGPLRDADAPTGLHCSCPARSSVRSTLSPKRSEPTSVWRFSTP